MLVNDVVHQVSSDEDEEVERQGAAHELEAILHMTHRDLESWNFHMERTRQGTFDAFLLGNESNFWVAHHFLCLAT